MFVAGIRWMSHSIRRVVCVVSAAVNGKQNTQSAHANWVKTGEITIGKKHAKARGHGERIILKRNENLIATGINQIN